MKTEVHKSVTPTNQQLADALYFLSEAVDILAFAACGNEDDVKQLVRQTREEIDGRPAAPVAPQLMSLADHNRLMLARAQQPVEFRNGIACPSCGKELVDSEPGTVLLSCPPQIRIACPSCAFTGLRFA